MTTTPRPGSEDHPSGTSAPPGEPVCICPWNNGYRHPAIPNGHHLLCPALGPGHSVDDMCAPDAHDDSEMGEDAAHRYLSTACLHGEHDYCKATTRPDGGEKKPATCKFCEAPCICSVCHGPGAPGEESGSDVQS